MRIYSFLIIMVGIMFTLNLAGIEVPSHQIIDKLSLTDLSNFKLSNFFNLGWAELLSIGALAAITIGSLITGRPELAILAGFSSVLLLFVADMIGLVTYTGAICGVGSDCRWLYYVILLILVPLMAGFVQSVLSWWTGRGE